jgi:hypothetical protein
MYATPQSLADEDCGVRCQVLFQDNAEAQSLSNSGRLAVHMEDKFFRAAAVAILTPGL